MKIGKIVKQLRKTAGLTQKELATRLSLTQTNISSIENNKSQPSDDVVQCIAAFFQVSPAYIYVHSMERGDVPEHKRELYDLLYPTLLELVKKLV